MRKPVTVMIAAATLLGAAACSQETEDRFQDTAEKAAADTRDNAEVVENSLREGAIVAADKVSEGADNLQAELAEDEVTDPDQGDGELDGTD